ncbi:hypothetical protein E2320_019480 [Naja naja]|nr:hypothetical protein E2320_019480 [Naja naja]
MDNCRSSSTTSYVSNAVQRDAPLEYDDSIQRLQLLENMLENNTQWLMKLFVGMTKKMENTPEKSCLERTLGSVNEEKVKGITESRQARDQEKKASEEAWEN